MKAALLVIVLVLCQGCGCRRGYVPHYILTDSPETKKAMHKCQEEPEKESDFIHETHAAESPK